MDELEKQQRDLIVKIAHTFLRTPYHPCGMVKGAGVDCLTLLSETFREAGLVTNAKIPHYSPEFMLHSSEEKYMNGLKEYAHEIEGPPLAGDIAMWKFGRCFSHAALVIEWPMVIHAYVGRTVQTEDVSKAEWLLWCGDKSRETKFFSYWGK